MPRHAYKTGVAYPARLLAAEKRPIENENRAVALVRLEFEMFQVFERDRELRSTGQIACRDLVLWSGAADDFGVVPFASALGVRDACKPAAWSAMAKRDVWVEIVFGDIDPSDGRNRFAKIARFSPDDYKIVGYAYDLSDQWVTTGEAAALLEKHTPHGKGRYSQSTIIRRVNKLEPMYRTALVRYTKGEQRRINLLLLRHLLGDPAWLDVARIECAQRIRALPKEIAELKRRLGDK